MLAQEDAVVFEKISKENVSARSKVSDIIQGGVLVFDVKDK